MTGRKFVLPLLLPFMNKHFLAAAVLLASLACFSQNPKSNSAEARRVRGNSPSPITHSKIVAGKKQDPRLNTYEKFPASAARKEDRSKEGTETKKTYQEK
jgi:hypothetical protein